MKKVNQLLLLFALAGSLLLSACYGSYYVRLRPAEPYYARPAAPYYGAVWIPGEWLWSNGRYVYLGGHWDRPRPGHVYVAGQWEATPRGYVWHKGYWR